MCLINFILNTISHKNKNKSIQVGLRMNTVLTWVLSFYNVYVISNIDFVLLEI